ncbi:MAG: RNA ligase family protein [Meiothermus sp.]|nr:RNA ligase family protein [Meiothermus sp.]
MSTYRKYPSTPHLPWSPCVQPDDVTLDATSLLEGKEVVVVEKLDGENTSMYPDYIHARSTNPRPHPSRDYVKALHGQIRGNIPPGWRLVGENVYALHSIFYDNLEGYFYLFSIWDEHDVCLSWDEVREWAALLELPTPKEFYRGIWDEKTIRAIRVDTQTCEGYVVRTVEGFAYKDFARHVAKWVRPNHIQTDEHWMNRAVVPNKLRTESR